MKILWVLIIFSVTSAYCQWELRYPDIPADYINDLVFTSSNDGYFVNEGGSLYRTTDGGSTWTNKKFIAGNDFYRIKFIDSQTGFTYARKNVIYSGDISLIYTTDAGNNWQESQIQLWNSESFLPVNLNSLIKAGTDIRTLENFFGNWITTYIQPTFIYGDSTLYEERDYGSILELQMLNDGRILALGDSWQAKYYNIIDDSVSYLLESLNNGESWDTLWCGLSYDMKSAGFADNNTGWMGGESERIYKTTDGGTSWFLQHSDTVSMYPAEIEQIFVLNEENIYASTLTGLLISNDGGITWDYRAFPYFYSYTNSLKVFFKDEFNGFAYGSDLYYTIDGGYNWEQVSNSIKDDIVTVDFVNELQGWALSYSKVYHSTDGGYNWFEQLSYEGAICNQLGLKFIDTLNGWFVGYGPAFATTNGGESWDSIVPGNGSQFFGGDIDFYDAQLGIMCNIGRESIPGSGIYDIPGLLVTTDAGHLWETREYNSGVDYGGFRKLRFIRPDSLWAINNKGIWLSNDTARTWQQIYATNYFLGSFSFDFINPTDGCFSQVGSSFYFSTNAGQSWQIHNLRKYIYIQDYQIIDKDISGNYRIFAVGNDGVILKYTLNNFNPDTYPKTYTGKDLHSLSLFMEGRLPHIWAAGEGFTILYGTTELIADTKNHEAGYSIDYNLMQNYPNPFNPVTNIEYRIPLPGQVTLKVYDILGNEIATLVNENKPAGRYKVKFDGSKFASGIYLYKMKAGNFTAAKKLILLK